MATARQLAFYVNGIDLAANAVQSFTADAEAEELDTTTVGDSVRSYITAFQTGTLSVEGIWDYDSTNVDEIHNLFSSALTNRSEAIITASLAAWAVGAPVLMLDAIETSYNVDAPTGQLIMANADFRAVTGINYGRALFNANVNTTTTNGTSVDNSASTANGGLFQVHYQAGDGTEDLTAKIQHSSDNATWADLGTITVSNITGFGARSLEIARGTTVNRYIRAQIAVAQGALTVQAAFARR